MSEEFKSEYKIFEDINLENNKIINVSEVSSYNGDESDKYNSTVKNSGLYIHTPKNPTTLIDETGSGSNEVLPIKDGGLIVTTGHAQTYLDKIDNTSNEINNVVNTHLNISSITKTDFMSTVIAIKSSDSPTNTEILIRDDESSDNAKDNGITITTDRTKIISTTARNKTTKDDDGENVESTILDFSSSVPSHIDLNRADIYQANTQIFVAGTTYGYPNSNIDITDGEANNTNNVAKGNALYVDTTNVNIYVDTTIDNNTTSITGELIQTGNVKINEGVYGESAPSTTIDGSSLNVNTKTVDIGNLTSGSVDIKTEEINIGTADTSISPEKRNTLNVGSRYSNLTIKGRDFLIESDKGELNNTKIDLSSEDTGKSYLRSYYTNSNDSYIHDLLTIGPNNTSSHLQLNGYADITGNLDVDGNIDVKDTVYIHSSGSEDDTTSYIKSNENNGSLQINNDTEVIISNAPTNGNDSNQISIKDDLIKTSKNLDLDANQSIQGTLIFDGNKDIKDLNFIKTSTLEVSNNYSTDTDKNLVLTIKTSSNNEEFSIDSNLIKLKNNDSTSIDNSTSGTVNDGKLKQTGNVFINTSNDYNTLIRGESTSLESATVNIGSESSGTQNINIGTGKFDNNIIIGKSDSNVVLKGKDLELTSTGQSTGKSESYLRVYDINTNTVKVNDSIIIGEKSDTDNSFILYGNADISNNLDVHNTIYLHSDDAEDDSLKSYIQSKDADGELVINNNTKVTISNGSTDPNKISITSDEIDTCKKLDLNANQEIEGTLTFDGSDKRIINLNAIQTSSLSIETSKDSTVSPYIKYNGDVKSIAIKSDTLSITSNNTVSGDSTITGNVTQTGDSTITGIIKINDGNNSNTTDIDGDTVFINPVNTKIGTEGQSTDIDIGHQSSDVTISGANRLEIKSKSSKDDSSETESKITVDKVSISNSTDGNKVNIYWDPSSSTLIFEKGQS